MSSAYWCGGFSTGLRCLSAYAVGPYHRIALWIAQTVFSGLAAYVRICCIILISPMMSFAPAFLLGSAIACILAHQRERHTGKLVGAGNRDQFERFGLQQLPCPVAQRITVLGLMDQHGMRANHEQLA
jgi:hypothetical protein